MSEIRAVIYARVSRDQQASEPVQIRHCEGEAARLDWTVVGVPYVDHGESAFSEKRERKAWERMLADAADGQFAAILAFDDDRLWRDYGEQSAVFVALHQAGVTHIHASRTYETASDDDRGLSAMQAVFAWQQSAKTRKRVKATIEHNVRRGKPNGGVAPFGYRRVYADKEAGREAALVIDEDEAREIRDAARRVIAGEPLRSIVRDWRARVPTRTGGRWNNHNLKRSITAPRVAGKREHDGGIVGDAAWDPILNERTWLQIREILFAPDRGPSGPSPRKHVLRGLAYCGRCREKLATRQIAGKGGQSNYICSGRTEGGCGKLGIRCERADEEVTERAFARLTGDGLGRAIEATADADVVAAHQAIRIETAKLDGASVAYLDGEVSKAAHLEFKRRAEDRIAAAKAVLARSQQVAALVDVPTDETALRAWWQAATVERRHRLLHALIERIDVLPAKVTGRRFDPERIRVTWKG